MKGGAISTNWSAVRQQFQEEIINNTDNFKAKLIEYYNKKLEKYDKMIGSNQEEKMRILSIDAENKLNINSSIVELERSNSGQDGLEDITEIYRKELLVAGDTIKDIYKTNNKLLNYNEVKNIINLRIQQLTRGVPILYVGQQPFTLESSLQKFLEICDTKLNTENLNIIRIEITELLLAINNGIINLKSYNPFNLILTGNPGIGKSFNAIIIAEAFKFSLLLAKGNVYNIKKPDIIGQYIGQTAPLVYKELIKGLESINFIDEAYSIAGPKQRGTGNYDKYGVEALDALTDFTSEHQSLFSVIVAGYPQEMKTQFLEVNSGLPRRFPSNILLSRYTLNDIMNISMNESTKLLTGVSNTSSERFNPEQIETVMYSLILILTNCFNYTLPVIKIESIRERLGKKQLFVQNVSTQTSNMEVLSDTPIAWFLSCNIKIRFRELNGTQDEILLFSSESRLPFNYSNTNNNPGIEWFVLCYLLFKTTNIPDGDLFKNQAADFIDYVSNLVNYLATFYKVTEEGTIADQFTSFINQFLKYISSRIPGLNATVSMDSSSRKGTIIFEDSQNFISNILVNPSLPAEQPVANNTLQQLIKAAIYDEKYGYNKLKSLEDDYAGRPFKLFTLQQLKLMDYNLTEFFNSMEGQEQEKDLDL